MVSACIRLDRGTATIGSRLRRIDDQIKRMEELKDEIDTAETLQMEAERASLSLPTGASAETLIRYSTTVDRQYYRALDELWKLQDRRRAEAVRLEADDEQGTGL